MVKCPKSETCGAKMIPSEKNAKVMVPACEHMVPHKHTRVCNNGVCSRVMPQSAACIEVEGSK